MAKDRNTAAQVEVSEGVTRIETTTETIFPVVFYARAGENSGVEIVAVSRAGKQYIFRLNDRQSIYLANDVSAMAFKRLIKTLP